MMNIIVLVFTLLLTVPPSPGTAPTHTNDPHNAVVHIPSWRLLAERLEHDRILITDLEEMKGIPEFKRILEEGTLELFLEMTDQLDLPIVQLAGFYGIRERYASQALRSAFAIARQMRPSQLSLYGPVYETIQDEPDAERFVHEFDSVMVYGRPRGHALALILSFSSEEYLDVWFHSAGRRCIVPSAEALVLDCIVASYKRDVRQITERMRSALGSYATIPGLPRRIFVKCADDSHDMLLTAIEATLNNDDLSSIEMEIIMQHRKELIVQHLDSFKLRPEVRRKVNAFLKD